MSEKEKEVTEATEKPAPEAVVEEEEKLVFDLSKDYMFEGTVYKKIDISGLNDLTAADMIAVNRILSRSGNADFLPEMSLEYACVLAAKGSKMPVEFYKGLPPKDAVKLKNRVTGFLYATE